MVNEILEKCIYEDLDNLVIQDASCNDTYNISEFLTTNELTQVVDCILNTVDSINKDRLDKVREFNTMFNQPVLENNKIPTPDRVKLRVRLILEELVELVIATGAENISNCQDLFYDAHKLLYKRSNDKPNLVDALDAFVDLNYVLFGSILEFGLQDNYYKAFDEVHDSNMSKTCNSFSEVVRTIDHHKDTYEGLHHEVKENGSIIVYDINKKVIKSINYKPAELSQFIK